MTCWVAVSRAETPQPATEHLTLAASLDRAAKNNPTLLMAKKDLSIAHTQLRQAKSLFYPKVNLNLDYVRYRNETLGFTGPELGNAILEAPIAPSQSEPRGSPLAQKLYLGRLGFIQTLYAGGRIDTTYKLSRAGVRRTENAYETLRHQVEFETTQHFYKLVALRDQEAVLHDASTAIEKLSKQISSSHNRLAVAAAQVDVRRRLSDLKQEEQTARFNYLRAMGLELFSEVEVEGELETSARVPDLRTVLVWAKENRAELKETEIQEEVDQLSVELSRSARYPVFLLGGGVEVRNDAFPVNNTNWDAALSMNIPIFDGFAGWARVKESKYRAEQGRLRRVQSEDQIEMEIRSAYSDWEHWSQEVKLRSEQKEMLDKARQDFLGKIPSADSFSQRLDYMRWAIDSNQSLVDAKYQRRLAEARLIKAVGRPLAGQ